MSLRELLETEIAIQGAITITVYSKKGEWLAVKKIKETDQLTKNEVPKKLLDMKVKYIYSDKELQLNLEEAV